MTIQKSRGYTFEKDACRLIERNRGGHSKRLGQPHQPDFIHVDGNTITVGECKSSVKQAIYVKEEQIQTLWDWVHMFTEYKYQNMMLCFRFKTSKRKHIDYYYHVNDVSSYACHVDGTLSWMIGFMPQWTRGWTYYDEK